MRPVRARLSVVRALVLFLLAALAAPLAAQEAIDAPAAALEGVSGVVTLSSQAAALRPRPRPQRRRRRRWCMMAFLLRQRF